MALFDTPSSFLDFELSCSPAVVCSIGQAFGYAYLWREQSFTTENSTQIKQNCTYFLLL